MTAPHGLTDSTSPAGIRMADATALDAIEDALGAACAYADLAREHAKMGDLAGLDHSARLARDAFLSAAREIVAIRGRHPAADFTLKSEADQ